MLTPSISLFFFFSNPTATTEIYTLSLHDALPISCPRPWRYPPEPQQQSPCQRLQLPAREGSPAAEVAGDRKSTRLNSSHGSISYAVFCLKKKKKNIYDTHHAQLQQQGTGER